MFGHPDNWEKVAYSMQLFKEKYTRFEKARIIGARALQISMGAPIPITTPDDIIDPVKIAEMEYIMSIIPITVVREGKIITSKMGKAE